MGIMPRPPDPLLLLRVQRSLPLKGSRLAEHFDVVDMAALQAHLRSWNGWSRQVPLRLIAVAGMSRFDPERKSQRRLQPNRENGPSWLLAVIVAIGLPRPASPSAL
jgi:hypothetical protein